MVAGVAANERSPRQCTLVAIAGLLHPVERHQKDKRGLPLPVDPFVFFLVGPDRLELSTNGLRVPPATLSRFAQVVVNVE